MHVGDAITDSDNSFPEGVEHIGSIHATIPMSLLKDLESRQGPTGEMTYKLKAAVHIKLGEKEGTLAARLVADGKEYGKADIAFSST